MARSSQDRRPRPLGDGGGIISAICWGWVGACSVAAGALSLGLLSIGGPLWDRDRRLFSLVARAWGAGLSRSFPMGARLRGRENVGQGPYIICANHQSIIDLLVMYLVPLDYRTVVKRSWFRTPLGLNIWLAGYIPTQRTGDPDAAARLLRSCQRWLDSGISLMMFPEGTRARDWRVHRFRRGAFELAVQTQTPILPVAIAGTNDVSHPDHWRFKAGCRIIVEVQPPIPVEGHDSHSLRAACREVISARVAELRAELRATNDQGPIE